jgi:bifunctional DNase/RNase
MSDEMIELTVETVAIDSNNAPVVVLRDPTGQRRLQIWIGPAEAVAITAELEGQKWPRPMTHDLIRNILAELQVKVVKLIISDMREQTYFARLIVKTDGLTKDIDCRPSDGIAIALRTSAPIFIPADLLTRIEAERPKAPFIVDTGGTTIH